MSRTKIGQGRALSKPIVWLLRDDFSDTRAAGAVNGTAATPGSGGARAVTDTENKLSVGGGYAVYSSGRSSVSNTDPLTRYTNSPIARVIGTLCTGTIVASTYGACRAGFGLSSGSLGPAFEFPARAFATAAQPNFMSLVNGTAYEYGIVLRTVGEWYLVKGGIYPFWALVWVTSFDATTPLYVGHSINNGSNIQVRIRAAASSFAPTPLASDGFGSSFGTTDGLGHAEGVTGGIGSGGGNVTWTQQVGTWANSAGKAAAATLSGGVAVATVPLPTKDVFAKVKVARSAGSGGMVLRWTDANNHLYTEHDGTNAYLKQVLSGSTTTLITAAATYSAGAEIVADLNGTAGRLYWNNALVGTTSSINSGLTATEHGLRSTDTGGIQLDDFVVYAKGTGGEYNLLNRYVNL